MGRAHEVRAKTIAKTNAAKSALYNRASKEIYLAAKSGVPDPKDNLALRSAIEKWKAQHVTKDVIDRAIAKAKDKDSSSYVAGRYEGFGPGGVAIMVDTLTDNEKRAFAAVRACFTHHGGKVGNSGSAAFNFVRMGLISFDSDKTLLWLTSVSVKMISPLVKSPMSRLVTLSKSTMRIKQNLRSSSRIWMKSRMFRLFIITPNSKKQTEASGC